MRCDVRRRWPMGVLTWIVFVAGCSGPTAPPDPPSGGEEFTLDFARFQSTVEPVLAQYGCNAMECHGGGIRGTYQLKPTDTPDTSYDFEQTVLQVDPLDPAASPLLAQPLAESAGGVPHPWEPFDSTEHPGYLAIRDWILAGRFE